MAALDDLRQEVRSWLAENWNPDMPVRQWWALMADAGWQFPTWPTGLGGRGLTAAEGRAVAAEVVDAGALGPPFSLGQVMGGPVVLQQGSDEQRARLVPQLANGAEAWCQFFSEPEAGSDLAGLRTNAEKDGDEWIINGQKVWTSGALAAKRGMLVARSNWDAPKHRGLSYFIIDVDQPGIEIRPLRQMNGQAHFNEVFFSDARVSDDNLIGGEGNGWASAVATLAYERSGLSNRVPGLSVALPGEKSGMLDRPAGELATGESDTGLGSRAFRSSTELAGLASERGKTSDPLIRQELTKIKTMGMVANWSGQRAREAAKAGQSPGSFANTAKLQGSHIGKAAQHLGPRTLGAEGMLEGEDAPHGGQVTTMALSVPSGSIAGGTDEIQRNIIGERGLGLPKDISVDRDMPFRDVPKSS
ncbi:MAG: acyl-CoA dehydrogenase family protein [Acidimicrobiales bacterium]